MALRLRTGKEKKCVPSLERQLLSRLQTLLSCRPELLPDSEGVCVVRDGHGGWLRKLPHSLVACRGANWFEESSLFPHTPWAGWRRGGVRKGNPVGDHESDLCD